MTNDNKFHFGEERSRPSAQFNVEVLVPYVHALASLKCIVRASMKGSNKPSVTLMIVGKENSCLFATQ